MTVQFNQQIFAAAAAEHGKVVRPNRVERVFGLHPALHIATVAGYFAFLFIMWAAFGERSLIIPFFIFAFFLAAGFGVPALWARIAPNEGPKANWAAFQAEGFDCATGHLTAGAATAQVVILPALLVFWGLAVAIIRAFV